MAFACTPPRAIDAAASWQISAHSRSLAIHAAIIFTSASFTHADAHCKQATVQSWHAFKQSFSSWLNTLFSGEFMSARVSVPATLSAFKRPQVSSGTPRRLTKPTHVVGTLGHSATHFTMFIGALSLQKDGTGECKGDRAGECTGACAGECAGDRA